MHRDPTEFRERFKRWKAGERVYDSGHTLPAYDDGKTPEETYYGQLLPTVTIEGHKPTLLENIGNWFVDASKRAAFNENPAVMTASGWTAYPDGSTRQDAFNTPERNDLANKLVDIGEMGAFDILPEAILTPAIEYGLKGAYKYYLTSPYYKKRVLRAINDAVGPWDKTKEAARAIIDDQLSALKKQKIHFVDMADTKNSNIMGRHFFDTDDNFISIKNTPFSEKLHTAWHELSHGTEEANPLIKWINDGIAPENMSSWPALGDFAEIRARANSSLIPGYLGYRIRINKKIPFRKHISNWIYKTADQNLDARSLLDTYDDTELFNIYNKTL